VNIVFREQKLEGDKFANAKAFARDFRLVFQNASYVQIIPKVDDAGTDSSAFGIRDDGAGTKPSTWGVD